MSTARRHTLLGLFATLLLATALLPLRHPHLVRSFANDELLEVWYDGYKSYAVMTYHIAYDSTYNHYGGMNYPYGEHVVPAAAHPFFTNTLKLGQALGLPVAGHLPHLLHAWLLLGWVAAAGLLFLLFRGLGLPVAYSLAVATVLVLLNPQSERLYAHFGLAQFYALPLLFYGLQRFEYRPGPGRAFLLLATTTWLSGIHFYYFAILNAALGAYFVFSALQAPTRARLWRYARYGALIVVPPLVGFYYWIYLSDPVLDRGGTPWGFLVYRAHWESIFLARELAHYQVLEEVLVKIRSVNPEGRAYVGLPAALLSAYLLVRTVRRRFGAARPRLLDALVPGAPPARHRFVHAALRAGVVGLLLSMAFPFNLPGAAAYVEYAGPLRQFRSLGRFAWIFYYGVNIYAAYYCYHRLRRARRAWRWLGLAVLFGVWAYECVVFARFFTFRTGQVNERLAGQRFTDVASLDYARYQAILPVPYFNVGVAQFGISGGGFPVQKALTASVQTGLPTVAAMLTRTSAGQTFRQRQLVSEPYRRPVVFADYPNQKPLLLLYHNGLAPADRYRYDHLLEGADSLYTQGAAALYALPLASFEARIARRRAAVEAVLRSADPNAVTNRWWSPEGVVFGHQNMEPPGAGGEEGTVGLGTPGAGYRGAGLRADMTGPIWVDMELPDTTGGLPYRSSFWLHSLPEGRANAHVRLEEWQGTTGPLVTHRFKASAHFQVFDPSGWTLVDYPFTPHPATTRLRLHLDYPDGERGAVTLDEWLVHPDGAALYTRQPPLVGRNNRYYE